jgi:hypothetical protein
MIISLETGYRCVKFPPPAAPLKSYFGQLEMGDFFLEGNSSAETKGKFNI